MTNIHFSGKSRIRGPSSISRWSADQRRGNINRRTASIFDRRWRFMGIGRQFPDFCRPDSARSQHFYWNSSAFITCTCICRSQGWCYFVVAPRSPRSCFDELCTRYRSTGTRRTTGLGPIRKMFIKKKKYNFNLTFWMYVSCRCVIFLKILALRNGYYIFPSGRSTINKLPIFARPLRLRCIACWLHVPRFRTSARP